MYHLKYLVNRYLYEDTIKSILLKDTSYEDTFK
jgi:hypothetical protein